MKIASVEIFGLFLFNVELNTPQKGTYICKINGMGVVSIPKNISSMSIDLTWVVPPFEERINNLNRDLEQAREDGNVMLALDLKRQMDSLLLNYQLEEALN